VFEDTADLLPDGRIIAPHRDAFRRQPCARMLFLTRADPPLNPQAGPASLPGLAPKTASALSQELHRGN
jgi:hypothetical protein